MMRVTRSRQLPTNHNHARRAHGHVIREYQFDSPSRIATLPGPGLSRDGPSELSARTVHDGQSLRGLTGSSISVLALVPAHSVQHP